LLAVGLPMHAEARAAYARLMPPPPAAGAHPFSALTPGIVADRRLGAFALHAHRGVSAFAELPAALAAWERDATLGGGGGTHEAAAAAAAVQRELSESQHRSDCGSVRRRAAQRSTAQHSTAQHSTAPPARDGAAAVRCLLCCAPRARARRSPSQRALSACVRACVRALTAKPWRKARERQRAAAAARRGRRARRGSVPHAPHRTLAHARPVASRGKEWRVCVALFDSACGCVFYRAT
jgi:hypothetical protein